MRALLFLLAACSQVPVAVRSAAPDERWPREEGDLFWMVASCREESGELAPALFEPLQIYVQDALVDRGARIFLDVGQEIPADEGTTVTIVPRDEIGSISINGHHGNNYYVARAYCVHVVRRAGAVTLVLELETDIIVG
jgi:hypothetical protein